MENKELVKELKRLRQLIGKLNTHYNLPVLFVGGMFRGMGILVGATLLVLVGSTILSLLGLLPGLTDIVEVISTSFDKARLQ
jgi:hypothetical protein